VPVVVVVLFVVAAAVGVWTALQGHDSQPRTLRSTPPTNADGLEGRWVVASGSRAGYRVKAKLASLPASTDVVGRTTHVTGGLTIAKTSAGLVVRRGARFDVDMRTLTSGSARRDDALRTRGLQTDRYPVAGFTLTMDVPVPGSAARGEPTTIVTFGTLRLHGLTKASALPVEAEVQDGALVISASYPVLMGDFGMHPPDIAGFVTVDIHGTMEFRLRLTKAS
jgi:polyisoprenoid-binding protein YceI